MASIVDAALRIKGDPSLVIDPEVVAVACREAKHAWRERTLDPVRTLGAFAAQITHGNTAIAHLTRLCGGDFGESAYCKARRRLPLAVFRTLLRTATGTLRAAGESSHKDVSTPGTPATPGTGTWKGHRTLLLDGTGCDMPDTPALQEHFGQSSFSKPGCGFPIASVLALFDAPSLMLLDLVISPLGTSDLARTPLVHEHVRPGDAVVGDRAFSAYTHLALLRQRGAHGLFRAHQKRDLPFPALPGPREKHGDNRHRRARPVLVEMITTDDQILEIVKPKNRASWLTREAFAAIPATLTVRVLRYRVEEKGFRSREIVLLTTLLDPVKYPAKDLAELYRARWQVEVNLRHLKQTLGMDTLHGESVDVVLKEMLMFALVYNAVCAVMGEAARRQNVPIDRVSFTDALRWLQLADRTPELTPLKTNPRRTRLPHPRTLKRGLRYPKMQLSRSQWRKQLLASGP